MSTARASCEATNVLRAAHSMTTSCCGRSETATSASMSLTASLRRLSGRRELKIWPGRFSGSRIRLESAAATPDTPDLMGHSSGAVHVADYVSRPEFHKVKNGGLAGAILVSGIYDVPATAAGDYRVYFGADPARYAEQSSLPGLLTTKTPMMVVAAELDPPGFVQQFELLKQASCKRASGCSRAVMLRQHSHMSEVYSINTADTGLTGEIIDFMNTGK